MQNINLDTLNGIITIVIALTAILGGGGILFGIVAVVQVLKARKDDLERAFMAADPKTQTVLVGIASGFAQFVGVVNDLATLLRDVTDGKMGDSGANTNPIDNTLGKMANLSNMPHAAFSEEQIESLKAVHAQLADTLSSLSGYKNTASG